MIHGYQDYYGSKKHNIYRKEYDKFSTVLEWIYTFQHSSISIKDVPVDRERARKLQRALSSPASNRTLEVKLIKNGITDAEVKVLAMFLPLNTTLEKLIFEGNVIGDDGVEALAQGLMENESLVTLSITHVRPRKRREVSIRSNGASYLAAALKQNNTLLRLQLEGNKIEDKGAIALAGALLENTILQVLDLKYNGISDIGGTALGQAIAQNPKTGLTDLILDGNSIADEGTSVLFKALGTNNTIRRMSLSLNNMSSPYSRRTSKIMAEALQANSSMTELDMAYNNFDEKDLKTMSQSLVANTSLTTFNLSDQYKEYFQKVIDRNIALYEVDLDNALGAGDKWTWNRSKLNLVGSAGAGKSSVVRTLLGENFFSRKDATVGVSIRNVVTHVHKPWTPVDSSTFTCKQGALIALQNIILMKDTESVRISEKKKRKKFKTLVRSHRATAGVPVQERRAQPELQYTYKKVQDEVRKFDKTALLDTLREEQQLLFTICDYGDQSLVYPVQHLFLTHYGIYIVVFNITQLLGKQASATRAFGAIEFWLQSIKVHVKDAPIYLVGTHLDRVKGRDLVAINEKLTTLIKTVNAGVKENTSKHLSYFPISNRANKGASTLRQAIQTEAQELNLVKTKVPLNWMIFLDNIMARRKIFPWLWFAEIRDMAIACGITSDMEIYNMLDFFHEIGMVVYFKDSVELQERIILDHQWLIDSISIDKKFTNLDFDELEKSRMAQDLDDLLERGIASIDILEYLCDKSEVHFIINLMDSLLMLSKWRFRKGEQYLIPSMIRTTANTLTCKGVEAILDFSASTLPLGIFERVVCLAVSDSAAADHSPEPVLEKERCRIWFGESCPVYLNHTYNRITMFVEDETFAPKCLALLTSFMKKLKQDLSVALEWSVRLRDPASNLILTYEIAKRKQTQPWFQKELKRGLTRARNASIESFLEG